MSSTKRALCVEDDPDIREGLCGLLEASGFRVTAEATAEAALVRLRQERYPLLITDLVLPAGNGAWLVNVARREGLLANTAVIMVTAALDPPKLQDVRVLKKPIDARELLRLCQDFAVRGEALPLLRADARQAAAEHLGEPRRGERAGRLAPGERAAESKCQR
jgi:CheY-like chemotaxis protein